MFIAKPQYDGLLHKDAYLTLQAGSITQVAEQLTEHLGRIGYSLLLEDVLNALLIDVQYYMSWAMLYAQRNATTPFILDGDVILEAFEWAIIYPVVMAHCHLLQAQLMESSRSLSGEQFGISVSEALSNYKTAQEQLQHESFIEPPFTVSLW